MIKMLAFARHFRTSSLLSPLLFSCGSERTVKSSPARGKFVVVPTPIGNLGDLSPNILKALFSADLIGCEDRRIAGQLYHLIRGRKVLPQVEERFGSLGLTSVVELDPEEASREEQAHSFYNYASMSERERRKFLRKMTEEEQSAFRLEFLKYRAKKVLSKGNEWLYPSESNHLDDLYGIDISDMKHIETQIMNCRKKKGRGVLIPLNTYSQTKMFDLVRAMLETKTVALVSDAGMPCISDPGWKLVDKIRTTMPEVPIQVVGGPCSVSILALQASVCSQGNALKGRFQGFSSLSTGYYQEKQREVRRAKMKEFSIHFINANKLKGRLLEIEQLYGGSHQIIVNNQLTKKFERRFEGTVAELLDKMDDPDFKPVGQISYLLYPTLPQAHNQDQAESTPIDYQEGASSSSRECASGSEISLGDSVSMKIPEFLGVIEKHVGLRPREKVELLKEVYGIKSVQAREYVYSKLDGGKKRI